MNARGLSVLTIGHSTHSLDEFLALSKGHSVTALVDVRSAPYSRFNPQFNRNNLDVSMKAARIKYVYLGHQLGGRAVDPSCYENGRVQYDRLAQTQLFRSGIERVVRGAADYSIALMCAEKDPLDCHRTLLVARALDEQGITVAHILSDGRLETHGEAMERLLDVTGLPHADLFRSRQELIAQALAQQEEKVAYVDEKVAAKWLREAQ